MLHILVSQPFLFYNVDNNTEEVIIMKFLQPPVAPSFLHSNIYLSALFSNSLNLSEISGSRGGKYEDN
jgi:hypothetical protein